MMVECNAFNARQVCRCGKPRFHHSRWTSRNARNQACDLFTPMEKIPEYGEINGIRVVSQFGMIMFAINKPHEARSHGWW